MNNGYIAMSLFVLISAISIIWLWRFFSIFVNHDYFRSSASRIGIGESWDWRSNGWLIHYSDGSDEWVGEPRLINNERRKFTTGEK